MPPELPGVESDPVDDPADDLLAELAEAEAAEAQAVAEADDAADRAARLRGRTPRPNRWRRWRGHAAAAAGGVATGVLLVLTALMLWQHGQTAEQRARDGRIVEAARSAVTALLSIDQTEADVDVQRVLELTTGSFREDFAKTADDFVETARREKAISVAEVNATALESAHADGGVVLVAAMTKLSNAAGAKEDRRPFRMSVTVSRDGEAFKMSELEFVP